VKLFKNLISYFFISYFKNSKSIFSLIFWIGYLHIIYYELDQRWIKVNIGIIPCLFIIMVYVGFTYINNVDMTEEQLIILKVKDVNVYYTSKVCFLYIIGLIFSVIAVIFPLMKNFIINNQLFLTTIEVGDVIGALIVLLMVAILGANVGIIFQPRYIKNRNIAIMLTVLLTILSIIKKLISQKCYLTKNILWILPPLGDIISMLDSKMFFKFEDVVVVSSYTLIYSIILMVVLRLILKRKLF